MTISDLENQSAQPPNAQPLVRARMRQVRLATLVMVGTLVLSAAIATAWFAGEGHISDIFAQIQVLQNSPPMWVEAPMVATQYLLFPTIILFVIVLAVTKISPQPRPWSRVVVVTILLVLCGRYLTWRSLSTLNLSNPVSGVLSIGLFVMELLLLVSGIIQLAFMLRVRDRSKEADLKETAVISGEFMPTVDILIPTYNESASILRRTVIGCQAIEYPHKTIYLLDDTRRPEIRALAAELGCEYMTRPDNQHAKAGNLNHAFPKTSGEFIVVFDADFVPTRNFLQRTLGFFQDELVALVQTPQSFYNSDPIAYNLGLENVLTPEEEVFYRQIEPIRDAAGSVVCSGTSFVARRSALEQAGGFVTDSLSEDYFTGVRLAAQGYRLVYLDEKLSAGLAAENIAAHATQRMRWARGTLQAFFIDSNPLTIRGLSPLQRLAHLEGLLHWFTSISQIYFLFMPFAYSFLGAIPLLATPAELLYFFLPYYLVQLTAFSWLNNRSRSALLSNMYTLLLSFPLAVTVFQVMLNPFSKGFKVTPKGISRDRFSFNWALALPLMGMFVLTALSLWRNVGMSLMHASWAGVPAAQIVRGIDIGWIWSVYNLLMLAAVLLILLDVPKADGNEWFDLRRIVRVQVGNSQVWGITTMMSEAGVRVAPTQRLPEVFQQGMQATVDIVEEQLQLTGTIVCTGFDEEFPVVHVCFAPLSLPQHRRLVETLFCRPGQWKRRETPGEWQSLFILFRILLRPSFLFERDRRLRAIAVSKV